jgi:peptide/nickel transport system substrate-binding protein
MLRTGEGDVAVNLEPEELDNLDKDPNLQVVRAESFNFIAFEILADKKPLDDPRVRQALNYAVDKDAIVKNVLKGLGDVHCAPVGPGVGAEYVAKLDCYKYDPNKAKQLLTEAGYSAGAPVELWAPTGRYLKDRQVAEAVQGYLKAVGVDTKIQTFEWAQYLNKWRDPNRQIWMLGRGLIGTDFIFTRQFTKAEWDKGANNNTHFSDPKVEELIPRARVEFDKAKRAAMYQEIQQIVWQYAPAIYLHTQRKPVGIRKNVAGVETMPSEEILLAKARKTS